MRIARWRYTIPLWLRGLLRRREVERDLDDELRDHIDRQTAANVAAGMTPNDARRAALVAFGGVDRIKDESRDVRGLSFIDDIRELRYVVRSLLRARTFTIATVTTIAIAVGVGCAVFALVNAILLRPLPYPRPDRLVALWHSFTGIRMPLAPQAPGTYAAYRDDSRSFEAIGVYTGGNVTVMGDDALGSAERIPASGVSASIFSILRTRPLIGRVFAEPDEQVNAAPVAMISENYWRDNLNAEPNVIGRSIHVDGTSREIVGVLPASFAFPGSDVRIWVPVHFAPNGYLGTFSVRAIGRLRDGITPEAAMAELQHILNGIATRFPEAHPGMSTAGALAKVRARVVLHNMRDDAVGGFEHILWLVGTIVGVLLVVALSNVASLVLARTESRRRELAVRATLGASAARLWGSLVTESIVLATIGGAIGLAIAGACLTALSHAGPTEFPDPRFGNAGVPVLPRLNEVRLDWVLVASVLVVASSFGLVMTMVSAWRLQSSDTAPALRDGGRAGTRGRASQRLRSAFVAVEVALSFVLLSAAAVLGRSTLRLLRVELGFDPTNVLTFWTEPQGATYREPEQIGRYYREALDRITRLPGVVAAGVVSKPPLQYGQTRQFIWVDGVSNPNNAMPADFAIVATSDGYFRAMGIPFLAGRTFDAANVDRGANEAVVSRGFVVRTWGDSAATVALGRRFRPKGNFGPWYTIVGVVGDVRDTSLAAPLETPVYLPEEPGKDSLTRERTTRDMAFVVRTRGPSSAMTQPLRSELRALEPSIPIYDVASMSETVAKAKSRVTFALLLLAAGAAATLALGVVGLYGVVAYVVGMRTREIGVRIALGMAPWAAARMILRQGAIIALIGTGAGIVVFILFAKLLNSLIFEVSAVDTLALVSASGLVLAVASLASWFPAVHAARIDPAAALRNE